SCSEPDTVERYFDYAASNAFRGDHSFAASSDDCDFASTRAVGSDRFLSPSGARMRAQHDTVVIEAGQAGLALSAVVQEHGREHVVLGRGQGGVAAISCRRWCVGGGGAGSR